jgi:hypothetical protein
MRTVTRWLAWTGAAIAALGVIGIVGAQVLIGSVMRQLSDGHLEAADYWSQHAAILSGGLGFDNIIGLPSIDAETVRAAGGSWYGRLTCSNGESPSDANRTSAAPADTLYQAYVGGENVSYDDGLPVVFSWPVATETVDPTDFRFTLNTGGTVFPHAAGMNPNWENDERNTVVVFGDLGNRHGSDEPGAIFPVRLEIVANDTPLTLVGPGGREVSAVGLTWTTKSSPYDAGPVLVGAKLNRVGSRALGEGGVTLMERAGSLPNDEFALYGGGDFRLRVLTTGGFSPDGVTGLRPDMFEEFFRVLAHGVDGGTVVLDRVGEDYRVAGGTLRIVGLSDLGRRQDAQSGVVYDDCYVEDRDNYIDIILVGDEAAARHITAVEIPGLERGYRAFYNPGGPGPEPTRGVRYTAPGPRDVEPVVIALDDPMRVTRDAVTVDPAVWLFAAIIVTILATFVMVIRSRRRSTTETTEGPLGRGATARR